MSKKEKPKKEEHDFNGPIEETATGLALAAIDKIVEKKDILIYNSLTEQTPEEKLEIDEAFTDLAISLVQMFAATDLPADYAAKPIDKLLALLTVTKNYIEGTVRATEDEILSRLYGAKSPHTGTYAKDVVTLGEMTMKLNEIREATGNDPKDYHPDMK